MGDTLGDGKAHRWMSEADAVRHICENTGFDDTDAKRDLRGRVTGSDMEVRARRVEFKPVEGEGEGWLRSNELLRGHLSYGAILEWTDEHIVISEDSQIEATGRPTGRLIATGIEVSRAYVLQLWPAQENEKIDSNPQAAPNKGGRPTKYEWEKINAFVIAYIIENGTQTIAEVVRALEAQFQARAEPLPDQRHLKRVVSKTFKYLEEFEQSRGAKPE